MTTNQIKILQDNDFTFGAHSVDHPKYSEISFEEKIRQTNESVNFIRKNFKEKYTAFAFPFNDLGIEDEFFNQIAIDLTFGSAIFSNQKNETHLQRFPMEGNRLNTKALLNFKSLYYFAKKNFLNKTFK